MLTRSSVVLQLAIHMADVGWRHGIIFHLLPYPPFLQKGCYYVALTVELNHNADMPLANVSFVLVQLIISCLFCFVTSVPVLIV